jgi:hypothetical protein
MHGSDIVGAFHGDRMSWTHRPHEDLWIYEKSIPPRIKLVVQQDLHYELQFIWIVFIEQGEIGNFSPWAHARTASSDASMALAEHVALGTLKSIEAFEHELMIYRENKYVAMEPRST